MTSTCGKERPGKQLEELELLALLLAFLAIDQFRFGALSSRSQDHLDKTEF
jgi:hypothetical protein